MKTPDAAVSNPARQRARALGESGQLERALAAIDSLNKTDAASRAETQVLEVEWLSKLGRCSDARALATTLILLDDAAAKKAAVEARAECDRLETPPTKEARAKMRARFRDGMSLEKTDPARAKSAYLEAWSFAPAIAVMLGAARAAKASGDAATAHASRDRALAFAEMKTTKKAGITASPRDQHAALREPRLISATNDVALCASNATSSDDPNGAMVVRHDLASNTVVPIAGFPAGISAVAIAKDRMVIADKDETRIAELGVDDELTALPTEQKLETARFSADGSVLGGTIKGGSALVIDAHSGRTLATIPSAPNLYGVSDDGKTLALGDENIRVFRGPAWTADPKTLAVGPRNVATVSGHYIATLADDDATVRVHDLDSRRDVGTLHGHFQSVSSLALTTDGQTLLSGSSTRAVVWTVATGKKVTMPSPLFDGATFTPDGTRIITSWDRTFSEVDAKKFTARQTGFEDEARRQTTVGSSGRVLLATGKGGATRFDLGARKVTTYSTDNLALALLPSPDDAWLAVQDGVFLYLFDRTGALKAKTHDGASMVTLAAFDGKALVAHDSTAEIRIDLATGKATTKPTTPPPSDSKPPTTSPDGKLDSSSKDLGMIVLKSNKGEATIEMGTDFAIVTNASGAMEIIGDEARVRCNVGWYWLPLDVCRDRIVAPDVLANVLP